MGGVVRVGEQGAAVLKVGGVSTEAPRWCGGWMVTRGQTQSLASSCLSIPKPAALCWQPVNLFTARLCMHRAERREPQMVVSVVLIFLHVE